MDEKRTGRRSHPAPTAFLRIPGSALAPLLAVGAAATVLALAGCRTTTQRIDLAQAFGAPRRDLDYTMEMLNSNARRWTNLSANCDITISNPQIPGEGHLVSVRDGTLISLKPGHVRLMVPSDQPYIRMVGDGKTYRVDMPVFASANSSYGGKYSDPVTPQQGRITFLPREVAVALEPAILLPDHAQMLTQLESVSGLYSLTFVTTPKPTIKPSSLIVLDRRTEWPAQVEEYNFEDGSLRAKIVYWNYETLPVAGEQGVATPTRFRIIYPDEQTTIEVLLSSITLNGKINPAIFKVPG